MTTKQENRTKMHLAVIDYLAPNAEFTKDLPDFDANFAAFKHINNEIDRITKIQSFDRTGHAKEKGQLQEVLILLALDNSQKLSAFAKLSKNLVLTAEIKFTKSKLAGSNDIMLSEYARMIYDKAEANLGALSAYGITQETQSLLLNSINAYNLSISKPRLGQTERSDATKQLAEYFITADDLLAKIDAVINILMLKQPNFYNQYKDARKVVDTGTSSLALKASAIEVAGGTPLKGVKFIFFPEGVMMSMGNEKIEKKTAEKGIFYLKTLPEGNYNVKVSKTGFKGQEVKVSVVPGEMAEIEVEMEKEG